ncbi:septum formation initiator family protein [Candidatus Microgenomates bacterium]|nr:septum formation initiator family protein [Candidatus Microgenomates bacterium]
MDNKKIAKLLIILFSVYLIVTTTKAIFDLWKAGDKLVSRQNKLNQLQTQRDNLMREKAKIDSPLYLEEIARDKLGMSKEGENVIIIPKELLVDNSKKQVEAEIPNWKKWINLLM